jgi:hypothetical protein
MISMKKIQFLALLGSMIGFSSCISIQPTSQSTSYEFDEAYWQPGEHFGEPQDLSAQDLKSENGEDYYRSDSPRRNSYAPGLNGENEYNSMGSMVPMWDPIMGWRLGYHNNQTLLGWGLNSAIGINPYGSYTPYYWNGSGFNSYGTYPGYYSNYPGMVYSPFGGNSPYGYGGYGYGINTWGYGYNGAASGWNNPYNNNYGWTNAENNATTSVPRPNGTSGMGSTFGQINRKPKSMSPGQAQSRKNLMVEALENVSKQAVGSSPRNNADKLERRQENLQRAGRVLEQVGKVVVSDINGGGLQPSSGGNRPAGPSHSSGGGSKPAPSTSPARGSAPSSKPSGTSPKRP